MFYLITRVLTRSRAAESSLFCGPVCLGRGGNIAIDPQFIILNNSLVSANAAMGLGGNILLNSDFAIGSNFLITATGIQGGTKITSLPIPAVLVGALVLPHTSVLSAQSQLQERCTALLRGDFSSFISIGRRGSEPAPAELQNAF